MVGYIHVNEDEFCTWLKNAWFRQHDGWDRGFWYDPTTNTCCTTCETKSTTHNPTGELILIAWVSGDNNADYDDICKTCSGYLGRNEETGEIDSSCCEGWEFWKECALQYTDDPSFKQMQFECMENVGWVENVKEDALKLSECEIEWI